MSEEEKRVEALIAEAAKAVYREVAGVAENQDVEDLQKKIVTYKIRNRYLVKQLKDTRKMRDGERNVAYKQYKKIEELETRIQRLIMVLEKSNVKLNSFYIQTESGMAIVSAAHIECHHGHAWWLDDYANYDELEDVERITEAGTGVVLYVRSAEDKARCEAEEAYERAHYWEDEQ